MNSRLLLAVFGIAFLALLFSGCAQQSLSAQDSNRLSGLEAKVRSLENSNKRLAAENEKISTLVGVYKSIEECRNNALVGFVDGNTAYQKTTLQDAFDRCDAVFSALQALAEQPA